MTDTLTTEKGTYRCTLRPFNALMQSRYIRIEKQKHFFLFKWYAHYADEPINEIDWECCVLDENHGAFQDLCQALVEGQEDLENLKEGILEEEEELDREEERRRIYREAKEDHIRNNR